MKKLIIISVFMVVVMAFASAELCYDSKNYKKVVGDLNGLCECIEQNKQDVSVAAVREKYDAARSSWDKMSGFSMSITNHNCSFAKRKICLSRRLSRSKRLSGRAFDNKSAYKGCFRTRKRKISVARQHFLIDSLQKIVYN